MAKKQKFIQSAIKRKGALRAKAKRAGLIKGDEKLSASDIATLKARAKRRGDTRTVRQANLATTLKKLPRRGKKKRR